MQLVSYWTKSEEAGTEEFNLRATVRLPDGRTVALPTVHPVFSTSNYRQQFAFDSMPYVGPGRYWFFVESSGDGKKWEPAAEIPFEIKTDHAVEPSEGEPPRRAPKPKKKKMAAS
jgi:hypothetical protein